MPYRDLDRRRAAKREQARRARSRRVGPVGPVGPDDAGTNGNAPEPADVGPAFVGPGLVGPGAAGILAAVRDELAVVRATRTDPLARGRVVASLANVALAATRDVETETKLAELARTVERLKAERDQHGPRRLRA